MPITQDSRQQLRKDFYSTIDIEVETNSTIALVSEYLAVGKPVRPIVSYFNFNERILSVSCRGYESEQDMHKAIMEIFYLIPSLKPSTTFILQQSSISINNGHTCPALITTTLTPNGALHEGYPYEVEEGEVNFFQSYELDENTHLFSKIVEHMLPVFSTVNRFPYYPSEILHWLSNRGHDIEFFGSHTPANIDVG